MLNFCTLLKPLFILLFFFLMNSEITSQVTGHWNTKGPGDEKENSLVEIYEHNGKFYGKIVKLPPSSTGAKCEKCTGDLKDKPIEGMVFLSDLTKTSSGGKNGTVIDPATGKSYNCFIELNGADKLQVKAYVGSPAFGKSQYWYRTK